MTDGGIDENRCSQILGLGLLLMLLLLLMPTVCNVYSNAVYSVMLATSRFRCPASSVSEKAREEAGRTGLVELRQ